MPTSSSGLPRPDLLWRRVGAGAIDLGVLAAVAVLAGVLLDSATGGVLVSLTYQVAALVVGQGRTGASPGKALVGLRTVDASGQPCGIGKALVRWLMWVVDGFPYCLPVVGFAAIFTNPDERRVGDKVAGTWVVERREAGRRPLAAASRAELERGPEPLWDDLLQAYVRDDPSTGRRQAFDEAAATWRQVDDPPSRPG
jgi:uncharacterized RDD family membrane protein YckC